MDISELFPAGPIIDEADQIGRRSSIEGLAERLRAGDVVRVFDRRRWGKSSVARAALARLHDQGVIAVRLPLDEYPTAEAAAAVLASHFLSETQRAASGARSLGGRLGGVLAQAGKAAGSEETSALGGLLEGLRPDELTLPQVLTAIPQDLARRKRTAAVTIDEAHLIARWRKTDRGALRAFFERKDRRAGVVMASSDEKADEKLRKPEVLGYLGEEFPLPAIDVEDWRHGLRRRFRDAGVPIEDDALEFLLDESKGHPYCTMLLAKKAAEVAGAFEATTSSVIAVALPTVRKHEAWKLRDHD